MKIEWARYEYREKHPTLRVKVDGHEGALTDDAKPGILALGYVVLGGDFEELWPPVRISPTAEHSELTLRGATDDSRLLAMALRFKQAVNEDTFIPGEIPVPEGPGPLAPGEGLTAEAPEAT